MKTNESPRLWRIGELLEAIGPEAEHVVEAILVEYLRAQSKHPAWPLDAVHASAILNEEAGELTKDALDFHFGQNPAENRANMEKEAVQCGAMSVRFLMHLPGYSPKGGIALHKTPACGPSETTPNIFTRGSN